MARGKTSKSKNSDEAPFGMGEIDKFNAERSKVNMKKVNGHVEEEESDENEEVLDLDLSDDEYDFDGEAEEGEGEEGEEGEEDGDEEGDEEDKEPEYDFDEDAYDRREKTSKLDEEDADILGVRREKADKLPKWERADFHVMRGEGKQTELGREREIEAAKELEEERNKNLQDEDFELDTISVAKPKKNKDNQILAAMNAELDAIELGEAEKVEKKITEQDIAESRQEKLARVKRESPELIKLLKEFKEKIHELNNTIIPILNKVKQNGIPTSEGISFLEAKHHLLLNYCINISFYLMLKAQGKSVKDHPVIDQLVRIRAIIEKTKPIEKKLSYQIDKLVRTANLGTVSGGDERLKDRANPADMMEAESDEEMEEGSKGLKLYKPPKIAEEIMETEERKAKEKLNKERLAKKKTKIAEFVSAEFGDAPEETDTGNAFEVTTEQERDLEQLEEANFRRKDITRADKRKLQKKIERISDPLADVGNFDDMAVFEDDLGETQKNKDFMMYKRMQQQMDLIDARKNSRKRSAGPDEELPEKPVKKNKQAQGRGFVFDDEDVASDDEQQEPHRRPRFEAGEVPLPEDQLEEGAKRKASKNIEKNRGLRRLRNKKIKTPHLKYKTAYSKKLAKVGHAMRDSGEAVSYSGEKGGINPHVSRSKSYTHQ